MATYHFTLLLSASLYIMDKDSIQTLFNILAAIATALSAFLAYKTLLFQDKSRKELSDLLALNGFISSAYMNRVATKYFGRSSKENFSTDRDELRKEFVQDPSKYRQKCRLPESSHTRMVANEMSHSLQDLGIAVFVGIMPLRLLLSIIGYNIALDWLIVKEIVDDGRISGDAYAKTKSGRIVHSKRRHAEWLGLITFLWLQKNWNYEGLWGNVLDQLKIECGTLEHMARRVQDIMEVDRELMTASTRKEILSLLEDILPNAPTFY